MKKSNKFFVIIIILISQNIFAQSDSTQKKDFYRDYSLLYASNFDIHNSTENFRTGLKVLSDVFQRGIKHKIKNKFLRSSTDFFWTFLVKWGTFLLPHEAGHWLRTNQYGGTFTFEKFAFPGIISKLELPSNAPTEHHAFALIGGFEANYLSALNIQLDFYKYDGLFNDELGMAFAHRLIYPLYAYTFDAQNPNLPQTWIEQKGDPINFVNLTWQMGGKPVFQPDSSVNEKLVKFYNQAGILSIIWNLIDWNFYQQAGAFFGNQLKGKKPIYLGKKNLKWSYSTLFNTSVLGVELYFFNHFKFKNMPISIYLRRGFPYQNQGFGIILPNFVQLKKISLNLQADFWQQEFYKNGFSLQTTMQYNFARKFDINFQVGYKGQGYLLGKPSGEGILGFLGVKYKL